MPVPAAVALPHDLTEAEHVWTVGAFDLDAPISIIPVCYVQKGMSQIALSLLLACLD